MEMIPLLDCIFFYYKIHLQRIPILLIITFILWLPQGVMMSSTLCTWTSKSDDNLFHWILSVINLVTLVVLLVKGDRPRKWMDIRTINMHHTESIPYTPSPFMSLFCSFVYISLTWTNLQMKRRLMSSHRLHRYLSSEPVSHVNHTLHSNQCIIFTQTRIFAYLKLDVCLARLYLKVGNWPSSSLSKEHWSSFWTWERGHWNCSTPSRTWEAKEARWVLCS